MRGRSLAIVLVAGLVATGCSGGSATGGTSSTQAPEPAGATPSPIAVQVCSKEAQHDMAAALGERARVSTPTWIDTRYACTYGYPHADPSGSFELSVKELSSWSQTYAYYDALAARLGKVRDLQSLGQGAFQTTRRLGRGPQGLEGPGGRRHRSAGAVRRAAHRQGRHLAVTVADVILGCWAGD